MTDLIAFFTARLDEDEAIARYSGPARVAWLSLHDADGNLRYTTVAAELGEGGGQGWVADGKELPVPAFTRIVYDPARVLREVEAGRAIVKRYERACTMPEPVASFTAAQDDGYREACMDAISDLAAVYSDHPDYREEWTPEGREPARKAEEAPAKTRLTVNLECGHEGWVYENETATKFAWCGTCRQLCGFTLVSA